MKVYVKLADLDALELAEALEFIRDWMDSASDELADSLIAFTAGGYSLGDLRSDLARFVHLLGSDDHRHLEPAR